MTGARRAQVVLAGVVALQLVAETALTPYWPLMFRRLFGIEELAATGSFLAIARIVGLAALPAWGLLALRWPVRTLLVAGLALSAVFDVALAVAPTWWSFTALSAGVMATGSVLVLAYPALIAVTERQGRVPRSTGVVTYWAVFHAASILATLVGAAIVSLAQPRWGLAAFAVLDLALAAAVWRFVPAEPVRRRVSASSTTGGAVVERAEAERVSASSTTGGAVVERAEAERVSASSTTGGPRRTERAEHWRRLRPWIVLVVAVVAVDAAIAIPRPYFVELLLRQGLDTDVAGWLFLAPGVAALILLPFAPRLLRRTGRAAAPIAAAVGGAGLVVQAFAAGAEEPFGVLAGRLVFGAGIGLLLVVLDLAVFDRIGTHGAAFSAIETGRSAALFAAPLVATAATGAWLGAPLLAGAVLLLGAGLLLSRARPLSDRTVPTPIQEADHVLDPVR